jgi:hypothetical protein
MGAVNPRNCGLIGRNCGEYYLDADVRINYAICTLVQQNQLPVVEDQIFFEIPAAKTC